MQDAPGENDIEALFRERKLHEISLDEGDVLASSEILFGDVDRLAQVNGRDMHCAPAMKNITETAGAATRIEDLLPADELCGQKKLPERFLTGAAAFRI